MSRRINQRGIQLIKQWEGFRGDFYYDQVGNKTIGYGHNSGVRGDETQIRARYRIPLSESDATDLLMRDLNEFEATVNNSVGNQSITDNQFAACVSFAFNMGGQTWLNSSILANIRQGDKKRAAQAFMDYTSINGQYLEDLKNRRQYEMDLFNS